MSGNVTAQLEEMLGLVEQRRELLQIIRAERERLRVAVEATEVIRRALGLNQEQVQDLVETQTEAANDARSQGDGTAFQNHVEVQYQVSNQIQATEVIRRALGLGQGQFQDLVETQAEAAYDALAQGDGTAVQDQDQVVPHAEACCVCYENQPQVTLLPCGHDNLCENCARAWNETPVRFGGGSCPSCRDPIQKKHNCKITSISFTLSLLLHLFGVLFIGGNYQKIF